MDLSSTQNEVDGAGTTANLPGGPQAGSRAEPEIKPQVGPVNEPKVGPEIEPMAKPANELTPEPRTKSSGQKNGRKIIGIVAAVAVVVAGVVGVATFVTRCNNPSGPGAVVSCIPKNVSHEEQVEYLRTKILAETFNLSASEISEVIAMYEEYFRLLNMQEFPEIYQLGVADISSRDLNKEYGRLIVTYTEEYDGILKTPDSAGQAYNNMIYYDYQDLLDKYYNLVRERQIEAGINPDEEGIG